MPKLVVGQRSEERAVATNRASWTAATAPPPPGSSHTSRAWTISPGGRHTLDAGELDPLDVPDDRDPCWHRLTLTPLRGAYRVAVGEEGLLAGVRVLDLSIWRPGPYATQLLVELGADVVKIEPPGGDPMRVFPTLFRGARRGEAQRGRGLERRRRGKGRCCATATEADVVVEGFRPGVVRGLGVDDESVRRVNPNVVYCLISGYGQHGPLAEHPGHDINYQSSAATTTPTRNRLYPDRRSRISPVARTQPSLCARGAGAAVTQRRRRVDRRVDDRRARQLDRRRPAPHTARRAGGRWSGRGLRNVSDGRRRLDRARCDQRGPFLDRPHPHARARRTSSIDLPGASTRSEGRSPNASRRLSPSETGTT